MTSLTRRSRQTAQGSSTKTSLSTRALHSCHARPRAWRRERTAPRNRFRGLGVAISPRTKGTDGTFSDIYLNYLVGQILIGGSRKRETPRLSLSPSLSPVPISPPFRLHS